MIYSKDEKVGPSITVEFASSLKKQPTPPPLIWFCLLENFGFERGLEKNLNPGGVNSWRKDLVSRNLMLVSVIKKASRLFSVVKTDNVGPLLRMELTLETAILKKVGCELLRRGVEFLEGFVAFLGKKVGPGLMLTSPESSNNMVVWRKELLGEAWIAWRKRGRYVHENIGRKSRELEKLWEIWKLAKTWVFGIKDGKHGSTWTFTKLREM